MPREKTREIPRKRLAMRRGNGARPGERRYYTRYDGSCVVDPDGWL
jgi:hypothetical protein